DDETVVTNAESARVVAASANGDRKPVVGARQDRGGDVGDIQAHRDGSRAFVDHRVVNLADFVVARISRFDQIAAQAAFAGATGRRIRHGRPPYVTPTAVGKGFLYHAAMILDEHAVARLLRMEDLIPAVATALADFSSGRAVMPGRVVVP